MSAEKSTAGANPPAEPEYVCPPLPSGIVKALRVFKAHFPELLKKHPRRWVACDGERVLYVGDSQQVLFDKCLKRGIPDGEFIVLYTLQDATEFID
ncbi:MAG: hypothetical protein C0501_27600 [Isosphaera sp.]|nr:hypothetical protein [Isosphaera sp.]